ncbi:MAG: radical SAM family heme chaperone HemW [Methyloceanibacter sp.]
MSSPPHPARRDAASHTLPQGERGSKAVGTDPASREQPFGVYVHWPFCRAKCPYCDFNSHVRHGGIDETRFLAAYLAELSHFAALAPGRNVASVFFGGGTPSLMQASTVGAILEAIAKHWRLESRAEITLEANPTSVEATRFAGYRACGVNRLSLGIQALDDASLKALGRQHTADEALAALDLAKRHFGRVSFDLIYAREGQTAKGWREELACALRHAADHLSLYQLTIEPGTPFAARHEAGTLRTPNGAEARAQYLITQELTEAAGLPAYEVSNHARPGSESRHNLLYWRGHDYAGIGPGAHSRISVGGEKHALATGKSPEDWCGRVEASGHGIASDETLSAEETAEEYLLMGLRLNEGIDLARFAALRGRALDEARVATLAEDGLVHRDGARLAATLKGRLVLDRLIVELAA